MNAGDIVLIRLPQLSGLPKLRPALVLTLLPGPYQGLLLCGISTQMQRLVAGWDEPVGPGDPDFAASGLRQPSIVRLSYLYAADPTEIVGTIGRLEQSRTQSMQLRLAKHLTP